MKMINVKKCPYKYYGAQNYKAPIFGAPAVINVDWFEMTTRGVISGVEVDSGDGKMKRAELVESEFDAGVFLVANPKISGSTHYKYAFEIVVVDLISGEMEAIGNMFTTPRNSKVLSPDSSCFKIYNRFLWSSGWLMLVERTLNAFGLEYNNITRLDISIDSKGFVAHFRELYFACEYGSVESIGRNGAKIEAPKFKAEGFSVKSGGKSRGTRVVTGYNASQRCRDDAKAGRPEKKYQQDAWAEAGIENDVERLEAKMFAKFLAEIPDFDWRKLEDAPYLAGLHRKCCEKFYHFREVGSGKNKSRWPKIEVFDYEYFDAVRAQRKRKISKEDPTWGAKRYISFLMLYSYAMQSPDGLLNEQFFNHSEALEQLRMSAYQRCLAIAYQFGVEDWFARKLPEWESDFDRQKSILNQIQKVRNSRIIKAHKEVPESLRLGDAWREIPKNAYKLSNKYW